MLVRPVLDVGEVAEALNHTERDIRSLAEEAKERGDRVEWPVLRHRTSDGTIGDPITDKDGWAYAVVAVPPNRVGRPASNRGESPWLFRKVKPPQRVTPTQRYLLPGTLLVRDHKVINAIAAAAGIIPGAPVRLVDDIRPSEPMQVIAADGPGPVLGILLLPEGKATGWRTGMGDCVDVVVRGTLLLPAEGPIGCGPGIDRLLWDPEDLCWRGDPVEGRSLLELRGSWRLDHTSEDGEPAAVLIDGDHGLRLELLCHPGS